MSGQGSGPRLAFEDFKEGETRSFGPRVLTREEIISFARDWDPQPFHLDEAAAERSHFGALCASGWHTALAWMRLMVDYRRRMDEPMRARGEPIAGIGPALGFRELKWLKPVYVGDTVEYKSEVIEMRLSNSRPHAGLMTFRSTGVNQNGEPVISLVSTTFVERRGATP